MAHEQDEMAAAMEEEEERLEIFVEQLSNGAPFTIAALSGDEVGKAVAQALGPGEKVKGIFMGADQLDGSESFAANGVADGARLVVETTLDVPGIVAKLNGGYRASGYGGGPATETSVSLHHKDFEAVPEEAWELVRCLPDLKSLGFYYCGNLRALPAGAPRIVTFFFGNHSASPAPLPRQASQASRTSSGSGSTTAPA